MDMPSGLVVEAEIKQLDASAPIIYNCRVMLRTKGVKKDV